MAAGGQGGADVDELQLQGGIAPEGVGLEIEGRVHPHARRHAARLLRHREEDGVKPAGALGEAELQVLALAHGLQDVHRGAQQGEHRPGIARAIGLQLVQLLHLRQRHLAGAGDGRVHVQAGYRPFPAGGGADIPVHPGPEGVDVLLGDGKARRQLVAAEALQQVGAGLQRGKQVEPAVGPAGTLAHAVFQMNHEAWAGVLLAEAGGHNPHHALVPVLAGEDQGAAVLGPEALDLLGGVGADGLLYRLPLPV